MPVAHQLPLSESWKRRLTLPAYSVSDAARYTGAKPQTIAYWHYGGGTLGPALPGKERGRRLSYLQLVEIAFVATFRKFGVTLRALREAHDYLAQTLHAEFPFSQYQLKTEGIHVLLELDQVATGVDLRRLIMADSAGQIGWEPDIERRFLEFEYENDLAIRWHVAGRQSPIVIDPRIGFGAPTVRGIATWAIRGRALAGEPIEAIAQDFALDEDLVDAALAFEGIERAA